MKLLWPTLTDLFIQLYIRKAEQHYSEKQIVSSQQPVHLKMAGYAEMCSVNKKKTTR
jgi:hypothetical protein